LAFQDMIIWYGMCLSSVIGLTTTGNMRNSELQLGEYLHAQSRSKIGKFRRDYAAKNIVFVHGILSVKTGTASTPSKAGMVAYQGGVHSVGVGIVIILLCFTNITSNINLNNAT